MRIRQEEQDARSREFPRGDMLRKARTILDMIVDYGIGAVSISAVLGDIAKYENDWANSLAGNK